MEGTLSQLSYILSSRASFARVKYKKSETKSLHLSELNDIILNMQGHIGSLRDCFKTEQYILRKMNYKMAGSHRKHKYFQALRKVRTTLEHVSQINLVELSLEFTEESKIMKGGKALLYLPSRERLDRLLASLARGALLLANVMEFCCLSAKLSGQQLDIEHFVQPNLIMLGTVGTVWKKSGKLLQAFLLGYQLLRPWKERLKSGGAGEGSPWDLPSSLDNLPSVAAALIARATEASSAQKTEFSVFFEKLLGTEREEFKASADNGLLNPHGTPLSSGKSSLERKRKAVASGSASLSEFLREVKLVSSMKELKKLHQKLERMIESEDKKTRRKLKGALVLLNRRWTSLVQLKRMGQRKRMAMELENLKIELVAHQKRYASS